MEDLIRKHSVGGVIVDTNILLLYVVGTFDSNLIPRFKRTSTFTVEDFQTLRAILSFFSRIVTTPHLLAETTNLLDGVKGPSRQLLFEHLATQVQTLDERYEKASELVEGEAFVRLGLADTAVAALSAAHLVITDDVHLYVYLSAKGVDVLNFNHIRNV